MHHWLWVTKCLHIHYHGDCKNAKWKCTLQLPHLHLLLSIVSIMSIKHKCLLININVRFAGAEHVVHSQLGGIILAKKYPNCCKSSTKHVTPGIYMRFVRAEHVVHSQSGGFILASNPDCYKSLNHVTQEGKAWLRVSLEHCDWTLLQPSWLDHHFLEMSLLQVPGASYFWVYSLP